MSRIKVLKYLKPITTLLFIIALTTGCSSNEEATESEVFKVPKNGLAFCESYVKAWNLYIDGQAFDVSFTNLVDSPQGDTIWYEAANQLEVSYILVSLDPLEQGRLPSDSEDLLWEALKAACVS
jgi:hypothetical protein